jgi:hypothetical protein
MSEQPSVQEAVNAEVDGRVAEVAAVAVAQVDQANKDAEALARAAAQSEYIARLNAVEGSVATWQNEMTTRLEAQRAEHRAELEAMRLSISQSSTPLPTPPVVTVLPEVNPESVDEEQGRNSKPQDTTPKEKETSQPQSQHRKRAVL